MSQSSGSAGNNAGSSTDRPRQKVLVVDVEKDGNIQVKRECPANQNGDSNNRSQPHSASNTNLPISKAPAADSFSVPDLLELCSMPYHSIRLKVFKVLGSSPCRYYYEPLVLLDPRSIQPNVDKATGQAYVRLSIQMWNAEVEAQVLNWLKRLPGSHDVEDYCVQTMPFEEIRLVMRAGSMASAAFQTPKFPTAYHRLDQSLQFHLICESKEIGEAVAESFKSDPTFAIQDLALECASIGVSLTAEPRRKNPRVENDAGTGTSFRSCTYLKVNVRSEDEDIPPNTSARGPAVLVQEVQQLNQKLEGLEENVKQLTTQSGGLGLMIKAECDKSFVDLKQKLDRMIASKLPNTQQDITRLTTQIADLNEKIKDSADNHRAVIPVFSASGLKYCPLNGAVTYEELDFDSDQAHGTFDPSTGLFTASSAGLYLFFFSGTSWIKKDGELIHPTCVELRVDGQRKAASLVQCSGKNGKLCYSLSISAMVQVKSSNVIGVFTSHGSLATLAGKDCLTRFYCIRLKE